MFHSKEEPEKATSHTLSTKGNKYNFLVIFFVALGSFTYGYNSAIIGAVFGLPSFYNYFDIALDGPHATEGNTIIGGKFPMPPQALYYLTFSAAANGLFAGGGIIGCLILSWFSNKFGRRPTIQITCVLCIVSAIIQGASVHVAMFLVGRLFNGIGVGMINVAVPLYQSELSPAKQRGRMVGSHGFLVVCGYVSASFILH